MEFYLQTMLGDQARVRTGTVATAHTLCDKLKVSYLDACAFWTPQWWKVSFLATPQNNRGVVSAPEFAQLEVAFKAMGDLCDTWSNPKLIRRSCFEGIGNITGINAANEPAAIHRLCAATSANTEHQYWCALRAAQNLSYDVDVAHGNRVCDLLARERRDECREYMNGGRDTRLDVGEQVQ